MLVIARSKRGLKKRAWSWCGQIPFKLFIVIKKIYLKNFDYLFDNFHYKYYLSVEHKHLLLMHLSFNCLWQSLSVLQPWSLWTQKYWFKYLNHFITKTWVLNIYLQVWSAVDQPRIATIFLCLCYAVWINVLPVINCYFEIIKQVSTTFGIFNFI